MKARIDTGNLLLPHGRARTTQLGEHDSVWLSAARWLSLGVQIALLVCLVVAARAGWELTEALRWNERLARQAHEQDVASLPVAGTASAAVQASAAVSATASAATTAAGSVSSVQAEGAASIAVGQVVAGPGAMPAGSAPRRERASARVGAAPVWADDAASAASAAATAASAAAAAPQAPAWLTDGSPPQWRFAQALGLSHQGDLDGALARYRSVFDDAALGNLARYNSANTLLREAMRLSATAAPGQALVMFELAKEGYRSVLRRDPSFWAARYNLERALQLQPDGETVTAEPAQQAERAATTMRSVVAGAAVTACTRPSADGLLALAQWWPRGDRRFAL